MIVLKNYNKQNHFNLSDGTYIKGVIKMDYQDFCKVYEFLRREYKKAVKKIDTYKRDSLAKAIDVKNFDRYKPFSVGITATKLIAKKFNLDRYKDQNYAIIINK